MGSQAFSRIQIALAVLPDDEIVRYKPDLTSDAPPTVVGWQAAQTQTFLSGREDERFVETAGFLHKTLQTLRPRLEFQPGMTRQGFSSWREKVREKLSFVLKACAF